jgi:hypothetical protein
MTLEKLQESLDGVYDLRDTMECHAVIRFLIRDLEGSKAREKQAREGFKSLAASVLAGDTIESKEKARDALSPTVNKEERANAAKFILKMGKMMKFAEDMNDEQISEEVLQRVWANLDMSGQESAMLGEMLARFKMKSENSNVVSGAGVVS